MSAPHGQIYRLKVPKQLSSSDHPLSELQIEPPLEPVVLPPEIQINPGAENPPWNGLDLLLIAVVLLVSLFFFSSVSLDHQFA